MTRDQGEWLSATEAAEMLGVHAQTVTLWARAGKLPHIKTLGGHRRFRRSEIEKLLEPEDAA